MTLNHYHYIVINTAKNQDFHFENIFFKKLPDEDDSADAYKPLIVKVMKDTVFIRIFEITRYCNVPANWWASLSNDFEIKN